MIPQNIENPLTLWYNNIMKEYFYLKNLLTTRQFEWVVEEFNKKDSARYVQFMTFRENMLKGEVGSVWNGVKNEFLALSLCMIGVPVCDYNGFTYNLDIKGDDARIVKQLKFPHKLDKIINVDDFFEVKTREGNFAYRAVCITGMGDKRYESIRYNPTYKMVKCDPFSKESKYIPLVDTKNANTPNKDNDTGMGK